MIEGTGIDVWEVVSAWKADGERFTLLREDFPWLTSAQLRAALAYYHRHPEEIDARLEAERYWTPEQVRAELPFLRPRREDDGVRDGAGHRSRPALLSLPPSCCTGGSAVCQARSITPARRLRPVLSLAGRGRSSYGGAEREMKIELKPLNEQVVVITGASSGIGLATARLAAKRGARVVLTSRDKADLKKAVRAIRDEGGEASYAAADVADLGQLRAVAEHAVREFGGIDTWINNAGVSIYGRIEEVPTDDARRLFETNYWGLVNGSLVALEHLREHGGALINVGSITSDRAVPLQGHYSASKHAVKGFTDALRMELEEEGAPVSVSLVKPSSIDTPFTDHARNRMDREPTLPPPVYSPRVVARAILRCAEQPVRDLTVGAGGKMLAGMGSVSPRLADRYMESTLFGQQKRDEPAPRRGRDTLFRPRKGDVEERGDYPGHVAKTSAYTGARLHPIRTALAVAALGAGVAMALRGEGSVLGGFGEGSGDWTSKD